MLHDGSGAQDFLKKEVIHFTLPVPVSIRAMQVFNDSVVWFAANHGVFGFTENGGATWTIDSLSTENIFPEFRSIAQLNDSTVLLLSVDSPAYLFKTTSKGKKWKQVYTDNTSGIFFDSMKFWDDKNGIALADPIRNCFKIIFTHDGGESWGEVPCENIPPSKTNEACFAASNSCISVYKNHVWFITGGNAARLFHSVDSGKQFTAYSTPMAQGGKMTGIFSVSFADEKNGAIGGGDFEKTADSIMSLCLTHDGGKSWQRIQTPRPVFVSSVVMLKNKSSAQLFTTGHNGTWQYAQRVWKELKDENENSLNYNTLQVAPSEKFIWMAGTKGQVARIKLSE
jgi:photosystem II stability/assembly factor-like uncharacterized protein